MSYDVIVVGGSFAGLSAAMQLARARQRILLIDAGKPRNRFAGASHGFLGQDGVAPDRIMREGVGQLCAYPNVQVVRGTASEARAVDDGFALRLEDGSTSRCRRLVLATGVRDELPAIPGLQERWGHSVVHCPYCHGYEIADQALGVLATHHASARQATLLADWGPTTYFTQGRFEPDDEAKVRMRARGVSIERSPLVAVLGDGDRIHAVQLADGRSLPIDVLFTTSRTHMNSPLAEQLGCALDQGPLGPYIRVDENKLTTVPGVYAAGDAASPVYNATLAAASGVLAGQGAHQSLAW
jgi:thioredoxin reductase